ncbi:alpha/beta hydrolase [Nocardiopsis coralliicola]
MPSTLDPPHANSRWWASLSADEQEAWISGQPERVGRSPGLPAAVCDRANRDLLARSANSGDADAEWLLGVLRKADANPDTRLLLLEFHEPTAPGRSDARVALAVGDPDKTANIAVHVPGTYNSLRRHDYMDYGIDGIRRLRQRSESHTGEGSVSAIYWLGYAAPQHLIPHAFAERRAAEGAPDLTAFLRGLRDARPRAERPRITAIGHSYGTVVIGHAAASGPRFPADAVLFTGSPGVGRGITHVSQLHLDSRSVFAAASGMDIVTYAPSGLHSADPSGEHFEAVRIDAGHGGHASYADPDGVTSKAAAYIVCGLTDRVAPHGARTAHRNLNARPLRDARGKADRESSPPARQARSTGRKRRRGH